MKNKYKWIKPGIKAQIINHIIGDGDKANNTVVTIISKPLYDPDKGWIVMAESDDLIGIGMCKFLKPISAEIYNFSDHKKTVSHETN